MLFVSWANLSFAQSSKADSLRSCADNKLLHDSLRAKACSALSYLFLRNRFLEEAESYAQKGIDLSKKSNFQKGYINSSNALAACYSETGRYQEAVDIFNECIQYCKKAGNTYGEMNAINKLGLTYHNWGRYSKAIGCFITSLNMAQKEKRYESIAIYNNNIALVYAEMNDYKNAILYTLKAIELEKKHKNDPESIIIRSINLSDYYNELNLFTKSEDLLQEALKLNATTLQNSTYEAYLRNNLGQTYFRSNQFDKSIREYLAARKGFENTDVAITAQIDVNLAHAYACTGQKTQALDHLAKGMKDTVNIKPEQKRYTFHVASLVYEKSGQYKLGLLYSRKTMQLQDSLLNAEQVNVVAEMQARYESQQKQDSLNHQKTELAVQQKLNEQVSANSTQKSYLLIISLVCIVILFLFSLLTLINFRKKQKANLLLQEQKKLVEQKNSENELLLGEIHHRVKNNLQVISSLLSLQGKSMEDKTARSAIEEGKQRVRSMELVHKMLYESNSFAAIEMVDFTRQLVNNLLDSFGISRTTFRLEISSFPVRLDVDTAVPLALIINELVVNSLKHAFNDYQTPIIRITMVVTGDGLSLQVADNGNGTDPGKLKTSESFGIKLVKLLTRQLNGQMDIRNEGGLQYIFLMKEYKLVT